MGCTERYDACWGSCERYKAYRQPFDDEAKKKARAREAANLRHDGMTKAIRKYKQ